MSRNFNPVQIKGQKEGLWILLDDQISTQDLFSALEQKLSSSNNFFAGADVTIKTGTRTFSPEDIDRLHEIIEAKYTLHIRDIERSDAHEFERLEDTYRRGRESDQLVTPREAGYDRETRSSRQENVSEETDLEDEFIKALDEPFRIPVRQRQHQQAPYSSEDLYDGHEENTLYFRGTVRSGQSLEFPGNILILGDVNPGAYVIASGDIIVMGRLNGVVHAGAEGEESAIVIGAGFFPSQLRIAQYIGRPPDEYSQSTTNLVRTEKASIKDGVIVIESIL